MISLVAAWSFAPGGWVAEWSNAHAWKACLPKGNQGSNPCPSAPAERTLSVLGRSPGQYLNVLADLDDARTREHSAKIRAGVDQAIPSQDGTRIDHGVATDLRSISHDRAEFSEAR